MSDEELERQRKLEDYKDVFERNRLGYSTNEAWRREQQIVSFRGVMDFALLTLRALLVINGGALVVLFALAGAAWRSDAAEGRELVSALSLPMITFGVGVVSSIFCSFFSYVAQVCFTELDQEKKSSQRWANGFRYTAIGAGFLALLAFCVGAWCLKAIFAGPQ